MTNGMTLLVPFEDQSENFTCGFEAGMIWAEMEQNLPNIQRTVKATNMAVLKKMAAGRGYAIQFSDCMIEGSLSEWVFMRASIGGGGGGLAANDAAAQQVAA